MEGMNLKGTRVLPYQFVTFKGYFFKDRGPSTSSVPLSPKEKRKKKEEKEEEEEGMEDEGEGEAHVYTLVNLRCFMMGNPNLRG